MQVNDGRLNVMNSLLSVLGARQPLGPGAGQAQPCDQVLPCGPHRGGRALHRGPRGHAPLLLPGRLQNVQGVGQAAAHPQDQVQGGAIRGMYEWICLIQRAKRAVIWGVGGGKSCLTSTISSQGVALARVQGMRQDQGLSGERPPLG